MPFTFYRLEIPDVILMEAEVFSDSRGFFAETYKQSDFARHGIPDLFVQDNFSSSGRAVLRGLHYQKRPADQAKLVSVTRGEIFDVAVDIRRGSPSYGKWVGEVLSGENHKQLYVPEGFAHGFVVLSAQADVLYKVTAEYSVEHERGILWSDPQLAIDWPIRSPILAARDANLPRLRDAENNFE